MDCSMPEFPVLHDLLGFKLMPIALVMSSNHLILCHLLLLPSIFPSIRANSSELAFCIRWPKYWSFSINPSNEYSGLISFRIDWLNLLAVQGAVKNPPAPQFKSIDSLVLSLLYDPTFIGEGNGTPLQYSCLENPMDGGAWKAAVHGSLRVGHD